ncbi:MAG: ABC transporter substrate-binding protein [Coxiellaceae bacterium]|jgi:polar amino acid transport system substrate-binding protein|nr:ABC transporter substrate-binding protein [Coxiellaceae bacterium]
MKKIYYFFCLLSSLLLLSGCNNGENHKEIKFATSADYPPFEYQEQGELKGFDIDLAKLVTKKLGKMAVFNNMQFAAILPALQNNLVDAAISTFTITEERQQHFDFSLSYYVDSMATIFIKGKSITDKSQLSGKKIACQLGTTMEIWLKKQHIVNAKIIAMDDSNQVVESVKSGNVDVGVIDTIQAVTFSSKNPSLSYAIIAQSNAGYGIVFKKGSPLKNQINKALESLSTEGGAIRKLQQKWFKDVS